MTNDAQTPSITHICVDIETLGNHPERGVIMSLGAVAFRMDAPIDALDTSLPEYVKTATQYYSILRLKEQLETYHCEIEAETLAWWLATPERATLLAEKLNSSAADMISIVFSEFKAWIEAAEGPTRAQPTLMLWSHGVTFDCMHLSQKWPRVMNEAFTNVVPFRHMRDTRTLFALYQDRFGELPPRVEIPVSHHALVDAWRTAVQIQLAWNALRKSDAI